MSIFDAINHAMTTVPTGGYSTHDASFGHFGSPYLQLTAMVFMILGGLPFVLYAALVFKGRFNFFKDEQFRWIMGMYAGFITVLSLWLWLHSDYSLAESAILVGFNVVSVLTTTGYATADYTLWGPFVIIMFFFLTYLGACAGSTSGGIKTVRIIVVARSVGVYIRQLLYPNGVFVLKYQGAPMKPEVVMNIFVFFGFYVLANAFVTLALALTGLDFITSISGAATALANVGPGLGDTIGPAGNFSSLSDTAKYLLSLGMLLGRLELLTVVVLLTPDFWRG
jgi:trk system potassium uptake protein TrkH